MSTKIIKGKDNNGNIYYSDMPVKQITVTLSNTTSGKVYCYQCGRIVFVEIEDIVFNQDITTCSSDSTWLFLSFVSGLPRPKFDWQVFRCIPNSNANDPYLELGSNGVLQVTMRGQEGKTLPQGKPINASFSYLIAQ